MLRKLAPEEWTRLEGQLTKATCRPGALLCAPGQAGDVLYILAKGQVQFYLLTAAGEKSVMATLGPGACFGEMPLIGLTMHETTAEAVDECTLYVMSRAEAERLLQDKPELSPQQTTYISSR